MEEAIKCKKCGSFPYVVKIEDCFYARCDKCTKWGPYQFLGITPKAAIRNWNEANSHIPPKPKKEKEQQ